jgi:uncharacterized protein
VTDVVVLAKAPRPGSSKTRLCPPCSYEEAATLAAAALEDTMRAVGAAAFGGRRVLALAGRLPSRVTRGWHVVAQRGHGLDERLAAAFEDVGGPALLIGMDTPQVTPALIERGVARLAGADALLGRALDGGFWAVGLRRPSAAAFLGVPMSASSTGAGVRSRLDGLGLRVASLPALRDVDTIDDAWSVADEAPRTRFAATLRTIAPRPAPRRDLERAGAS